MTENKRVVITGMGALSPIGNDAQTNWENALKGVNGIDTITRVDTEEYKTLILKIIFRKKMRVAWIVLHNMQ